MKVAEYVADFVSKISPRVYGVCGAGAMHLNDAFANHPGIRVIPMQHEQAAAMAADAEARVTGQMSVISVTTGPGGTNSMTGVACAYVDSIPMLIIAGQVTKATMIKGSHTRQIGMNELPMVHLMTPITKMAVTLENPASVPAMMEIAYATATTGRQGPVFVEIPLDVQAAEIDVAEIGSPPVIPKKAQPTNEEIQRVIDLLSSAKRPLVLIGNGVRLSGPSAVAAFKRVFNNASVPVVSTWGAADLMPTEHPSYIGRAGLFGDRASNFAVQGADAILAIGTRLSVGVIGHGPHLFAPNAKKIVVDIDAAELKKRTIKPDVALCYDAAAFLTRLSLPFKMASSDGSWLRHCRRMRRKYPSKGFWGGGLGISSYEFVQRLGDELPDDAIVVTDVGFCFIPTFQTMKIREGQRLIHAHGVSPMGWGIPGAIGAAFSSPKRQIVCLVGDGGLMMNLQELETIAEHRLPIAIFVFENGGYVTMKIAQRNHFNREVMAGPGSGLSLPNFVKVAKAFGIVTKEFMSFSELSHDMPTILDIGAQAPVVVVIHCDRSELIAPRLQAMIEDGKFIPADLSNMWPHLPEEEREANLRGPEYAIE